MSELQEETAIQIEQQQKSNKEIVDNIIKMLAENNLTITDAREILQIASKKLGKQTVSLPSNVVLNVNPDKVKSNDLDDVLKTLKDIANGIWYLSGTWVG